MDLTDESAPDTHFAEADGLSEIARRLEIWASEVEGPASHSLRSIAASLEGHATHLLLIGAELATSRILAEEEEQQTKILRFVENLSSWIGPLYLKEVAHLAEQGHFIHLIRRLKVPSWGLDEAE